MSEYRNLLLEAAKGHPPVCIGPGILHKQKLEASYKNLPVLMKKYWPGISGVLVFGTDGEENLTKGLQAELDVAKHLWCDIHLRDNIKNKLKELALDQHASSEILADIFCENLNELKTMCFLWNMKENQGS